MKTQSKRKKIVYYIILMLLISIYHTCIPIIPAEDPVNLPPIANAGGPYVSDECVAIEFDGSLSWTEEWEDLLYIWDFDNDGIWDTEWSDVNISYFTWYDDFDGTVQLMVSDGVLTDTNIATVQVLNIDPEITNLIFPSSALIGDLLEMTIEFMDEDPRSLVLSLDSFTVTIDWGDGSISIIDIPTGDRIAYDTHIYYTAGVYDGNVTLVDDDGGVCYWDFTIIIDTSILDAGPDVNISEGDYLTSMGSVAQIFSGVDTLGIDWGDGSDELVVINPDLTFNLSHQYLENGSYELVASLILNGNVLEDSAMITVLNCDPNITMVNAPEDPLQISDALNISALFTDAGVLDTHTATIEWGDGTSDNLAELWQQAGGGQINGSHLYPAAGVYVLTITVYDDDGGMDQELFQYIVVFDPDAGFVTGGGWIDSPAGAYVADPTLTGKATFGFVSKYLKGRTTPSGNTEFNFNAGDIHFHSSSYDWLIIAGIKAMYKGEGQINNDGNYSFILTAIDGGLLGGGNDNDEDKFRIKIWDKETDQLIYDNQIGALDGDDPTTVLGSGSIIIHTK